MNRIRFAAAAAACALAAAWAALGAAGDGGPAPGVSVGWAGVTSPDRTVRYVTFPQGPRTLVAAIGTRGGIVQRFGWIRGSYGIPLVAFDGTAEGLTRDGSSLILAGANAGRSARVSRFALVDARKLRLRRVVTLPGSFSYDAISPDGKTLYLIHYLPSTRDVRYHVRAYDLRANRLLRDVVVDPREASEPMNGSPLTRATSASGTWAYTFYGRGASPPFVHALDTAHRRAVCIDLPWRDAGDAIWNVRMTLRNGDRQLVLRQPGIGRLAIVDTKTYKVRAFRRPVAPGPQSGR